MQTKDRAIFKIRFEHSEGKYPREHNSSQERRFKFWYPYLTDTAVRVLLAKAEDSRIDDFEQRLVGGKFADELAKRIHESAGKRSSDGIDAKAADIEAARARLSLTDFSISVVGRIHYGSVELTMLLEGVQKVVDAFDNNFEWFESLLESFAPEAWGAVISPSVDSLKCSLIEMESLKSAFSGGGVQSPTLQDDPTPAQDRSKRVQWLWVVSNTSLIIPFALALAVLYFSSRHMEHIQGVALKLYADNRSTEAALINIYESRETELHKTLIESVKAANSRASVEPCCCSPIRRGSALAPSSAPKEPASCGATK